ncbi:MAG: hypothetical protein Q8R29_01245 [bacterium]|nr:hypothetical protein [bacterium]
MKIGLFLHRSFAYVGHELAVILKKKYGIRDFCGYVQTRDSYEFLKNQKEIEYSSLLLDEDVQKRYKSEALDMAYLKNLEMEYGLPNLWPYIEVDRIIRHGMFLREYPYNTPPYTHEEMLKILQVNAKAIINFLDKEKPDFVIFVVAGPLGGLLLYQIAKKRNIKTFVIMSTRVEHKYSVTDDYNTLTDVEKTYKKIRVNHRSDDVDVLASQAFLNRFRSNPLPPSSIDLPQNRPTNREKQFRFLSPRHIFRSLGWLGRSWWRYLKDKNKDDYSNIKPWHHVWDKLKRKLRVLIGFDDLYDKVDFQENFAFYALQLEPEIASLLFAPFYTDQLYLIKQIARSLPVGYKLYIKEHPAMFGFRPRYFYKQIKKIPNAKLINPSVVSTELLKNAKLVVTTTGTAGWEAILFKKPVITFGRVFYNILPMVKHCRAIEDLPYLIKEQLENFAHDEQALLDLIAAVYKESADVDMVSIWQLQYGRQVNKEKNKKQLTDLADLIFRKIKSGQ